MRRHRSLTAIVAAARSGDDSNSSDHDHRCGEGEERVGVEIIVLGNKHTPITSMILSSICPFHWIHIQFVLTKAQFLQL
ncbi:hypothetical protein AAHA92_09237 [Salvia divinorum]|uniref:Uncharacterized protein n=1 Tax=Salvia divinorum TaxID=28513 RepID=A0ABD1HUW2_SALDI